jgi:hypothetical protein
LSQFVLHRYELTLLNDRHANDAVASMDGDRYIYKFGEVKFSWRVEPRGGLLEEEIRYGEPHHYKKFDYLGVRMLKEVPEDPQLAYRGVSWEEWSDIDSTGWIRSKGWYNLGQPLLTLLGDAGTALHYVTGFTPWFFKPAQEYPSVVIGVPKKLLLTYRDDPKWIPKEELAIRGRLSAAHIEQAWVVVPKRLDVTVAELHYDLEHGYGEWYGSLPSGEYRVMRM